MKRLLVAALAVAASFQIARAQTRFSYSAGQELSPAYEGWMQNTDGSYTLYFGYMNTNWLQQFEIPVGPDNNIEPGGPDQGQPTHFYPRRNPFLFTIKVPKDFGKKEVIWTLSANGKTNRAYASLKADYEIDKQVISTEIGGDNGSLRDELRDNIPPELRVDGPVQRTVKAGQPLELAVIAGDPDNLPARRDGRLPPGMRVPPPGNGRPPASAARGAAPPSGRGASPEGATTQTAAGAGQPPAAAQGGAGGQAGAAAAGRGAGAAGAGGGGAGRAAAAAAPRPPVSVVASSGPGLRFAWSVYRGQEANVTFTPDQMKTWMDTRAYANSPWSPPYTIPLPPADGRWVAQATFKEPGTYILRGIASDGSLFTYENVTVTVTP